MSSYDNAFMGEDDIRATLTTALSRLSNAHKCMFNRMYAPEPASTMEETIALVPYYKLERALTYVYNASTRSNNG